MLKNLSTYLQFGNHYCGIEHTQINNKEIIIASILKKSKNEVNIEGNYEAESIEEITKKIPLKQHVFLIINNNQVLTKRIEGEQIEPIKLLYKAFPNINIDDFYYEILNQNKIHFVSICRKEYADEILDKYQKSKISVINFSLGNLNISNVINYINNPSIRTSNNEISLENNFLTSIEKKENQLLTEYDINGIKVNENQVLQVSGVLATVLNNNNPNTNYESLKFQLVNDFKQLRFFNQFFKIGLVFILGILLINFMFFNNYFNKVNDLQQVSQVNQSTKSKVLKLNETVGKSQKMVDDMLKSKSSKSSFYLNSIIKKLPNSIILSELNYQPLIKRIKAEQQVEIENNSILITGETSNSELFSKWISDLEAEKWIKKIDILDYGSSLKATPKFSIKIKLTNE